MVNKTATKSGDRPFSKQGWPSARRADLQMLETRIRDPAISEGWSKESFVEEVMSEPRLTWKKNGSRYWRESVPGSRRL